MSSAAAPISAERFAEAIEDLPVGNLHMKAAEIRNSILHLEVSNEQLKSYANEGDRDCAEALQENREVIARMEERLDLIKSEVMRRGPPWPQEEEGSEKNSASTGGLPGSTIDENRLRGGNPPALEVRNPEVSSRQSGGRLRDEGLVSRTMQRVEEDASDDEGLHI